MKKLKRLTLLHGNIWCLLKSYGLNNRYEILYFCLHEIHLNQEFE